jgi:ATP-dependent DNA helicase RecG
MDLGELRELIRRGKGQTFDWHPRDVTLTTLAESLVALANSAGGTVLIGLTSRTGRPQGLHDPEATVDLALAACLSVTPPLIIPLPRMIEMDGRALVAITVPRGLPHVYQLNQEYLSRDGVHNRTLATRAVHRLMIARGGLSWDAHSPEGATCDDLDWDAVAAYVGHLGLLSDVPAETVLLRRGCLASEAGAVSPTYAGLLLFGREPQRWVRGAEIELARFGGREMSDTFTHQAIGGTLPEQLRQAEAFLADHIWPDNQPGAGLARAERPSFPLEAAREALVNAVAHRDYGITGDQIRVFLFADRLEIVSPGRLPGPVTVKNIVDERFSRNEVIVQVLADLGFVERLGYGIDRMIRLMREAELPPPRFEERAGGFRVILLGVDEPRPRAEPTPILEYATRLDLNPRQQKSLAFLMSHRHITSRDYQTLCPEVHPETLRRDLADLVRKDILLKVGDKRATYYILKNPGPSWARLREA